MYQWDTYAENSSKPQTSNQLNSAFAQHPSELSLSPTLAFFNLSKTVATPEMHYVARNSHLKVRARIYGGAIHHPRVYEQTRSLAHAKRADCCQSKFSTWEWEVKWRSALVSYVQEKEFFFTAPSLIIFPSCFISVFWPEKNTGRHRSEF